MGQTPWWAKAIEMSLTAVFTAMLCSWVARSQMRPRPVAEALTLVHPRSTLIFGIVCFVVFSAFAVLFVVTFEGRAGGWERHFLLVSRRCPLRWSSTISTHAMPFPATGWNTESFLAKSIPSVARARASSIQPLRQVVCPQDGYRGRGSVVRIADGAR